MHIIFMLIPLSLVFLVASIVAFRYAIRSNQYDDLEAAANSIILDDREVMREIVESNHQRNIQDLNQPTTEKQEV